MRKQKLVLREGFWFSPDEPHLPKPIPAKTWFKGCRAFVDALMRIESSSSTRVKAYKGSSRCRICGQPVGNEEYTATFAGITFTWPQGYLHYVQEEKVRPSLAFEEWVRAFASYLEGPDEDS